MTIHNNKDQTLYCHGLPGSAFEISTAAAGKMDSIYVLGPHEIDSFETLLRSKDYETVHVVGFSLGAMGAIEIAAKYPQLVRKLTLIAPAAPLELGDFLPHMAGRPVFRAAKQGETAFRVFTFLQNLIVKIMPEKLIETMFIDSPPAEKELLEDDHFQSALIDGLQSSLGRNAKAYCARICRYVKPWAEILEKIQCRVSLHHGELDNWAPVSMSHALAKAIDSPVDLVTYPKLGHYSTLRIALPKILKDYEA